MSVSGSRHISSWVAICILLFPFFTTYANASPGLEKTSNSGPLGCAGNVNGTVAGINCENVPNAVLNSASSGNSVDDCNFETGNCGYKNQSGAWLRINGKLPTGPDTNHTNGTSNGYYMYAKSAGGSSVIMINDFKKEYIKSMRFWYYMNVSGMDTLKVFVALKSITMIWKKSGNQGKKWISVCANVELDIKKIYIYVNILSRTKPFGDIAIDDISLSPDLCPGTSATTSILPTSTSLSTGTSATTSILPTSTSLSTGTSAGTSILPTSTSLPTVVTTTGTSAGTPILPTNTSLSTDKPTFEIPSAEASVSKSFVAIILCFLAFIVTEM